VRAPVLRPRRNLGSRTSGTGRPYASLLRCCLPRLLSRRLPQLGHFGAQFRSPHARCLRFVVTVARVIPYDHARLASGWRSCLGRTGIVPAGSRYQVSAHVGLTWASSGSRLAWRTVAGPKCVGRPRDAETAAVTYNVLGAFVATESAVPIGEPIGSLRRPMRFGPPIRRRWMHPVGCDRRSFSGPRVYRREAHPRATGDGAGEHGHPRLGRDAHVGRDARRTRLPHNHGAVDLPEHRGRRTGGVRVRTIVANEGHGTVGPRVVALHTRVRAVRLVRVGALDGQVTVNTLFAGMKVTLVERNGAVVDALGGSESGWDSRFRFRATAGGSGTGIGNRPIEPRPRSRPRCAGPGPG